MGQFDHPGAIGYLVVVVDGSVAAEMVDSEGPRLDKMVFAGQGMEKGGLWVKVTANDQKHCGRVIFDG